MVGHGFASNICISGPTMVSGKKCIELVFKPSCNIFGLHISRNFFRLWLSSSASKYLRHGSNIYFFSQFNRNYDKHKSVSFISFLQSLQVVLYFGSVVAILYYYGVIQFIMTRIAWVMQFTMGTTAAESLNAAASVFLGCSEAPILIKPYLSKLTDSEMFAVMVAGLSCIAGSLFAAYASFGVNIKIVYLSHIESSTMLFLNRRVRLICYQLA